MDSAQVEADTAALQKYVERLKGITDTTTAAQEKTKAFDEILGDSSQIAKDVARNTNNLDDVMKVYTASTKTATSVTAALGATLKSIGWNIAIAAVVAAIGVAVKLADEYLFHPYEHARDKAAEMSQAHEEAAQKVEELTKQIEELMLFLSEYTVTDDHGHELVTIDDQIVAIPREKIKYIELSYDEKSDVKKYWFKR